MSRSGCLVFSAIVFLFCPCVANASAESDTTGDRDARKLEIVQEQYRQFKREFPGVADIMPDDARALLTSGKAMFIDVRRKEEQAVSMIRDAVTAEAFLRNPTVAGGKVLVVYCTIGYRSGVLARQLAPHGIHARNLVGGILAWTLTSGAVYNAGEETRRLHVYGDTWRLAPEGYETVTFGLFRRF